MDKKFSLEDLDKQGADYSKEKSVNYSAYIYKYRYRTVRENVTGPKILEVGVGHADVTKWLSEEDFEITSIDGSAAVLEHAAEKVGNSDKVTFVHTYFEEFETDELFDDIFITNSLEHVDDPVAVLNHIKKFLKPSGKIHITVPNAMSVHRMLGVAMGMLDVEWALNEHDHKVGHQRVYNATSLEQHVTMAGLRVVKYSGVILKTLSNSQMNELIDKYGDAIVDGLYEVGKRLPLLSAELYFCCEKA